MPAAGPFFTIAAAGARTGGYRWPTAIAAALLWLIIILGPSAAAGYVLPGRYVTQLMIEHLNLPRQLRVQQHLNLHSRPDTAQKQEKADAAAKSESRTVSFKQTAWYRLPGQFRSDIQSDRLQQIHVADNGEIITVIDGTPVSAGRDWTNRYKDLFLFHDRRQINSTLADHGIDVDISSHGRFQDTICYVIGAEYPDMQAPQLWIKKDGFRPIRWIVEPAEKTDAPPRAEIRFPEWRRVEKTWYPRKIEFYENGRITRTIAVDAVTVNPAVAADRFDTDALYERYQKAEQPAKDDSSTNEIQQQIEEFKQLYE